MIWNIYLSGEINSHWREQTAFGLSAAALPLTLNAPVCNHSASNDCGDTILGAEDSVTGELP